MNIWQILAIVQSRPDVQSLEHEAAHTLVGLLYPMLPSLVKTAASVDDVNGLVDQLLGMIPKAA